MKKTILGISFLMMAAFAGTAVAQNAPQTDSQNACKTEKCDKKADCKKDDCKKSDCKSKKCDKREVKACKGDSCKQSRMAVLFEGLNLTDQQKAQVADLQKAMMESRSQMAEKMKAEAKAQKCDSSCNKKELKREMMAERKNGIKELRTKYLADLKNILTPSQYEQFLTNYFVNVQPSGHQGMKGRIAGAERRFDKDAKDFKKDMRRDGKEISRDAKKFDKDAKKDMKRAEKKMERKADKK